MAFGNGGCAAGIVKTRAGKDLLVLRRFWVILPTPGAQFYLFFLFFLLFCRFPSSSGAGGSVTLVRGGILGREDARGSAVLCPRALPGYLL